MRPATALLTVLLAAVLASPAAAKDRIVFASQSEIWLTNPDGTGVTNLTQTPTVNETSPRWTPDGSRIVYGRTVQELGAVSEIWSMAPDGTDRRGEVVAVTGGAIFGDMTRDGRIVFARPDAGRFDIWITNPAGTPAALTLKQDVALANGIDASPIEDSVLYIFDGSGPLQGAGTFLLGMDGTGGQTNILAVTTQRALGAPRFSPDGQWIIYVGCDGQDKCDPPNQDVWIMRNTGADRRRVVDTTFATAGPAISADGRRIVHLEATEPAGPLQLRVANIDGTASAAIPNLPGVLQSPPDWEPGPGGPAPAPAQVPAPAPGAPPASPASPAFSGLRLLGAVFRPASRGGSIGRTGVQVSYTLAAPATVTFRVERRLVGRSAATCRTTARKGRPCTIVRRLKGSFRHRGGAGPNGFRFTGRLAGRALAPGRYALVGQGPSGPPLRAAFRITGRPK